MKYISINFGLDKNFINNFINYTEINYSLTKEQIQQLNEMIIISTKNAKNKIKIINFNI